MKKIILFLVSFSHVLLGMNYTQKTNDSLRLAFAYKHGQLKCEVDHLEEGGSGYELKPVLKEYDYALSQDIPMSRPGVHGSNNIASPFELEPSDFDMDQSFSISDLKIVNSELSVKPLGSKRNLSEMLPSFSDNNGLGTISPIDSVSSVTQSRSQSSLTHDKVNQYRGSHSSAVVKVVKDPVFTKWQEKQLSGDKVSLKAQQSFLERKLAESWVLNRKKYEHELRIINSLLSQELTNTLYKVKQGSLTEAELIVHNLQKQLQSEMGRIRTAIDEAAVARQRIDRLEFEYNHARALLEKREDYQIKQRELAQQQLQTVDLVSTPVHPEINISVDVDMRIEAALSKLNAIDPAQDLEGFLALSQTVLDDLREQGLLTPELNQDQKILAIFAKAVLRRLNPITQFKDVTKLTYYLGKKIFCEMHPHWTAAEIERAHSSWDRFYETLKAMDPRSLTQEQWAEFLGTVVGDFAFFGGIGKVVHYFAQAPVTIEAIQARPLDYAHSVIQYEELKTAYRAQETLQKYQTIFKEICIEKQIIQAASKAEALELLNSIKNMIPSKIETIIKETTNTSIEIKVFKATNESYWVTSTIPGRVPGSKAIYYNKIASDGKRIEVFKDTFDQMGKFVHRKYKA